MPTGKSTAKEELAKERAALERDLQRYTAARRPVVMSAANQSAVCSDDIAWGNDLQIEMRQSAIRFVEAALERVHEGTYGTCEHCGRPIEPERLDADMATALCAKCAGAA